METALMILLIFAIVLFAIVVRMLVHDLKMEHNELD